MDEDLAVKGFEGVDRSRRSVPSGHEQQIASPVVYASGALLGESVGPTQEDGV